MKKIKLFLAACLISVMAYAAANSIVILRSRTPQNVAITAANSGKDTLTGAGARNVDTGVVWAYVDGSKKSMTLDFYVAQLTGSITATSHKVYGCYDTTGGLLSADWEPITGVTTYCAACIGASSTTVPGTARHYKTFMPANSNNYNFIMAQGIHTGTFTATYTGKLSIEN